MPSPLARALEQDLLSRHGPMIGGDALRQALGYPTMEAFRQALCRELIPIAVFALPHRHGKFALTKDVAVWLASLSEAAEREKKSSVPRTRKGGVR